MNGSDFFSNTTNHALYGLMARCQSKAVTATIYSLIIFVSLIGNLLVVATVYRNKSLRTTVNYFIVNMAISDILMPWSVLDWWITYDYLDGIWLIDGILGTILCKIVINSGFVSVLVSMFSMLAIAMDRFHAVVFPMRLPLFSHRKCLMTIAFTWIASLGIFGHFLYAAKTVSSDTGLVCVHQWDPDRNTFEVMKITWITFLCLNLVSAVVLTVLYSTILLYLYRQQRSLRLAPEILRKRAARNRKISLMLVLIVVVFYVIWTPYHVMEVNIHVKISSRISCIHIFISHLLTFLGSAINPIVYFTFNEGYRQGLMEMLCCTWYSRSVSRQNEGSVENAGQMNNAIELHEQ